MNNTGVVVSISYHGGHQYAYQILSAVEYALQKEVDSFAIEGKEYEDSMFYVNDKLIAIGEAKMIESKKHWTLTPLFYSGSKRGPLIQLWNRCKSDEISILFSSIPLKSSISNDEGKLAISDDELAAILENIHKLVKTGKLKGIKKLESLSLESLKSFLDKLEFIHIPAGKIEQAVLQIANTYGPQNLDGLNRLLGYLTSPTYIAGSKVTIDIMLRFLQGSDTQSMGDNNIESIRAEIHTSIIEEFEPRGWIVDFDYKLISTDFSDGIRDYRHIFEIMLSRFEKNVHNLGIDLRFYIPIRCLIPRNSSDNELLLTTKPLQTLPLIARVRPRRFSFKPEEVRKLTSLLHETELYSDYAVVAGGSLASDFNPVFNQTLADRDFLIDHLPRGDLLGETIFRQIGGDLSTNLTVLCPTIIVDGIMKDRRRTESDSKIQSILFARQDKYVELVQKDMVGLFASTLTIEFEHVIQFLSKIKS